MIVSVIANGVSRVGELLEPIDVGLLEHAADAEEMNASAALFHQLRCLNGVVLGRVIEISLLVVPFLLVARGIGTTHLQIKRDRNQRFLVVGAEPLTHRKTGRGSGAREEIASRHGTEVKMHLVSPPI